MRAYQLSKKQPYWVLIFLVVCLEIQINIGERIKVTYQGSKLLSTLNAMSIDVNHDNALNVENETDSY